MASKMPSVRNRHSKADKSLKVKRAPARSVIGRIADAVLPSGIRSRVPPWQSSSSNNDVIPGVIEEISIISDDAQNKLGTESLGSELHCASKQVADLRDELAAEKRKNKTLSVNLDDIRRQHQEIQQQMSEIVAVKDICDLRDKLDDATCELTAEKRKNKTLLVNLDDVRRQHQEIQQQMSEIVAVNDRLSRLIKDMETHSKETQFLMDQRNVATIISLQEAKNELCNSKTEAHNLQSMLNDKNEQCRQLQENLEEKDLYVQMSQDQLELTWNVARDMLASQGDAISLALVALSDISNHL